MSVSGRPLSKAQIEARRKGGHARAAQFTPESQRYARSRLPREACVKGYRRLVERHGEQAAGKVLQKWREKHPSSLESTLDRWLTEFNEPHEREVMAAPGIYVDFLCTELRIVFADGNGWHSNGGPHGEDREGRDRYVDAKLWALGYRALRLPEREIKSGAGRDVLKKFLEET